MSDPLYVTLTVQGGVAVLRIDHPPVNALSMAVVEDLVGALDRFDADAQARALVVACAGRTFVAGADIADFDRPGFSAEPYNRFLARLEASARPVVAAMHGTVLGGGLELALACHARVAEPGARFGLPEVKLGLLPGSLGTQRLPRLVGIELALDLIGSGRTMAADAALQAGLLDRIADEPLAEAIRMARGLADAGAPLRRASGIALQVTPSDVAALEAAEVRAAPRQASHPAQAAIVLALRAARLPFEAGAAVEAALFDTLRRSATSQAMRHLFFARRAAWKVPGLSADVQRRPVRRVGVVGAGTMGRGIAMSLQNAGLETVLVDAAPATLDTAVAAIRGTYDTAVAKGRLTPDVRDRRLALLRCESDVAALSDCDLVIEAVYEDLGLKKSICARLSQVCRPDAIIASNTSTLDVDAIAAATGRPADVLGLHFFSPAHVMRLLEVVRGRHTSPQVLATAMDLAKRLGKEAVVSGVCYGFIGNRMAEVYLREAEFLLMEGASPAELDAAMEGIGMAMGPCRMLDMAGVDVGAKTVIERERAGGLPADPAYRVVVRALHAQGRDGQKTGSGFYRYDGRSAVPDPAVGGIVAELAARHGVERRDAIDRQEIVERLLYPMVNEAARLLEEGIASRGSDIDVVWTAGYGFPEHRGGPLFMADGIGLGPIVDRLHHYARAQGDAHGYWSVSPLLSTLASQGRRLSEWEASA